MNSEQKLRTIIYGVLILIVIGGGYFFFQVLNQTNVSPENTDVSINAAKRKEYVSGDTSVLDSQKFKDLQPVVVSETGTSTIKMPNNDLTDEQLATLPRNPRPFEPSF